MRNSNQNLNSSQKGNTGLVFVGIAFCLFMALMTFKAGVGLEASEKAEKTTEKSVISKTDAERAMVSPTTTKAVKYASTARTNEVKKMLKTYAGNRHEVKTINMVETLNKKMPSLSVTIIEETKNRNIVMPKDGDLVSIHYQGLFEDGKEFDSSYKRGRPLTFEVGAGQMIQGMDQGVKMIPIGSKAKLYIPWHLAYGEHGRRGIPSRANLIFVIEVLEVQKKPSPHVLPKVDQSKAKMLGDLKYWVLKSGNGIKPKLKQKVTVHYTGWFESGKVFDSSLKRNAPFTFSLGGRVIKGWNKMVANMSMGESVFISIPSHLAYGPYGRGSIPGGATLLFQIDLIDFK